MGKNSHGGFTPPKGKPTGNGRESTGLRDAFAGIDPETENEISAKYLDEKGEPTKNVDVKHVNRHPQKGEDTPEYRNPPGNDD
jgi:hypothetical protein